MTAMTCRELLALHLSARVQAQLGVLALEHLAKVPPLRLLLALQLLRLIPACMLSEVRLQSWPSLSQISATNNLNLEAHAIKPRWWTSSQYSDTLRQGQQSRLVHLSQVHPARKIMAVSSRGGRGTGTRAYTARRVPHQVYLAWWCNQTVLYQEVRGLSHSA